MDMDAPLRTVCVGFVLLTMAQPAVSGGTGGALPPLAAHVTPSAASADEPAILNDRLVEPLVGVHYFPGWGRGSTDYWNYGTMPLHPERLPLLGNYTSDQRTVDAEIAAASEHGVGFFDLLYYDRQRATASGHPELRQGYQRFMESTAWKAQRGLRWMITYSNDVATPMSDEAWHACVADWIKAFQHPNYLRIDGRPVFKILTPHFLLNRQCSIPASNCSAIVGSRDWPTAVPSSECPAGTTVPPSTSAAACAVCGGCWDVPTLGFRCAAKRMSNVSCVVARLRELKAAASAIAGLREPLIGGSNFWPDRPVPSSTASELGWRYDFTGTYNMGVPPQLSAQCAGTVTPRLNCTSREFPYAVCSNWTDVARTNHSCDLVPYLPNAIASFDPRPWHQSDLGFTFPTREEWEVELRAIRGQTLREPRFGLPGSENTGVVKALTIYAVSCTLSLAFRPLHHDINGSGAHTGALSLISRTTRPLAPAADRVLPAAYMHSRAHCATLIWRCA